MAEGQAPRRPGGGGGVGGTREADWEDEFGRRWRVLIPADAPDEDAPMGLPIGPPPLDGLDLPLALEIRLHNQLHARGILTARDAERRTAEISAAIAAAVRLDAHRILRLYTDPPPDQPDNP